MNIADKILSLRQQHGLTQEELGRIASVTDKAVSSWENGTRLPRMGAIEKMANYFGITKSEIIEGKVPTDINRTIAQNITLFLDRCGKTQQEFADFVGVSQATVSNWCQGVKLPRMNKIDKICDFLKIKRSDLFQLKTNIKSEFASKLKLLRESNNMTQHELAEKLKVSKSTVSMYELGNREPDFDTLEAIA